MEKKRLGVTQITGAEAILRLLEPSKEVPSNEDSESKRTVHAFLDALLSEFKTPAKFGWLAATKTDADRAYVDNVIAITSPNQLLKFINGLIGRDEWSPNPPLPAGSKSINDEFVLTASDEALVRAALKKALPENKRRFEAHQRRAKEAEEQAAQAKADAGRYTFKEAAAATGEDSKRLLESLYAAARSRQLPFYQHGEKQRVSGSRHPAFHDEIYWDDLNQWLLANEPRIEFRFPQPAAVTGRSKPETPKAKRASWGEAVWSIGQRLYAKHPAWSTEQIAVAVQAETEGQGIKSDRGKPLSAETIRKALAGLKKSANAQKDLGDKRTPNSK